MQLKIPTDGGPIYAETNLTQFIAEPWNAISSLAIALPSVYWAIKLNWDVKRFGFLYFLIPLLFLGGMGSTFYHAFRTSKLALAMDVIPTAIVTLSVGLFFWYRVVNKWYWVVLIVFPLSSLRFIFYQYLTGSLPTNLTYFVTGFIIFSPLIWYLIEHQLKYSKPIIISLTCLSISLVFRRIDHISSTIIPIGSHFLWHIFSGIGAFYLAQYLYFIRIEELSEK